MYVQGAQLNGKKLETFWFPASELLKGGALILEMGPEPNTEWGKEMKNQSEKLVPSTGSGQDPSEVEG